ncbi:4-hydroxy-tetrahydrodipicolinate reductase [Rhabdochlamydiaceae symbiont of Dictyostelium giganteum]|uniref:4-hydroxy-tetrahydrodipicolinate reductase n=1 Tax=Rhabdochlamydiaceae symbiont of Dictyostelium giganteum TaxID=3342349 RepID=UPI00384DE4F4
MLHYFPMKVAISISGAQGKMGKAVSSLLEKSPLFLLASSILLSDVVIDFSSPSKLPSLLKECLQTQKPLVIGTTGYSVEEQKELEKASQKIPVFYAPNFSIGMALLMNALDLIKQQAPQDSLIHITETHHVHKKDTPSGSALLIANGLEQPVSHILSIRSNEAVGTHHIAFELLGETLSLQHEAHERSIFARGALEAALFLMHKPPGYYTMKDLMNA